MSLIIHVQPKNKEKSHKSISRFFTCIQIIFSLDFGYVHFSSKIVNFVVKALTFIQCLVFLGVSSIYFLENTRDTFTLIWIIFISTQYFFNSSLILFFGRSNSYCVLQETLMSIDTKLLTNSASYSLERKVNVTCVMCATFKIFLYSLFCYEDHDECIVTIFGAFSNMLQLLSHEVVLLMFSFTFYSVYCRMRVLNEFVKNTNQVFFCLQTYKSIVEAVERPKKYFDYLYTLTLILKTPDFILTAYLNLLKGKDMGDGKQEMARHQVVRYLYNLHNFVLLCLPAICAGVVSASLDKLKIILQDKLLLDRDTSHEGQIQMFIDYVKERPMKFTMFKIIPLDWTLPVYLLNICITYQIAIVQFTKLY